MGEKMKKAEGIISYSDIIGALENSKLSVHGVAMSKRAIELMEKRR